MKKNIFIIIAATIISATLIIAPKTSALAGQAASLSCPTTTTAGSTVTCTLAGSSTSGSVSTVDAVIRVGTGITYGAFTSGSKWQGDDQGIGAVVFYTSEPFAGNFSIGTFTVNVAQTGSISVDGIRFGEVSTNSLLNVSPLSATITVVAPVVTPPVTSTTTTTKTTTTVPTTKTTTPATTTSSSSTKSSNAYLASLTTTPGTIIFQKDIFSYSIDVIYAATSVDILATAEDSKSSVAVSGNKDLLVGSNTATVVVTAESGATETYTITINRLNEGEELSDSSFLAGLKVSGYSLNFNKNTLNYDLVIKDEKTLQIEATAEDLNATVTISGNENLKPGSKITITVVSQSGDEKKYTISVKSNTLISSIVITLLVAATAVIGTLVALKLIKSKKQTAEPTIGSDLPVDTPSNPDQTDSAQPAVYTDPEQTMEATMPGQPVYPTEETTPEMPSALEQPAPILSETPVGSIAPAATEVPVEPVEPIAPTTPVDTSSVGETPPSINYFQ